MHRRRLACTARHSILNRWLICVSHLAEDGRVLNQLSSRPPAANLIPSFYDALALLVLGKVSQSILRDQVTQRTFVVHDNTPHELPSSSFGATADVILGFAHEAPAQTFDGLFGAF